MIISRITKLIGIGAFLCCTLPIAAQKLRSVSAHSNMHQNLIASQRNVSEQIKVQETREFMDELLKDEQEPEIDIYTEGWNSSLVNPYAHQQVPNNVRIDVSDFAMPVPGYITSPYGYRPRFKRQHKGVDLKLNTGDTVYAAFSGKVRLTRFERGGYGYYVILRHANGLETVYGHLSRFLVKPNQEVRVGDPIALGGSTGRSTGPHLHFETRFMGYAINPCAIFDFANQTTHTDSYTFNKSTYTQARNYAPSSSVAYAERAHKQDNPYSDGSRQTYRVKKGDTLYSIANAHGTTVDRICKLNGLTKKSKINPGKVLRVK